MHLRFAELLRPDQKTWLIPGGTYGERPERWVEFAKTRLEVWASVGFLWASNVDGSDMPGISGQPEIRAAYVAAGIDVIALHVYDPKTVPRFHDGPEDDAVWRDEFLAQHCADLEIQLTTRPGPLVPAVLEVAASQDVDIIALPTRGDTAGIADSFVHEVLTSADRPVALVPVPRTPMVAERSA